MVAFNRVEANYEIYYIVNARYGRRLIMRYRWTTLGIIVILILVVSGCEQRSEEKDNNPESDLKGNWSGTIKVPGPPLKIDIKFDTSDDLRGSISIPVQGIEDYPLSKIKLEKDQVVFTMDIQGDLISFDGHIKKDEIEGDFTQQSQTFPFTLKKGEREDKRAAGDFLSVETNTGTVHGELELPEGDGDYPVMLIIPGSGPTDRNGNTAAGDNNSLKYLAEELSEQGIASVRYDKPGAGKNAEIKIPEEEMVFDNFVDNAITWVELLQDDERFSDVGIIGHSQGSLEGILAAQETDIDLFISLAGAGNSIDKVLYHQLEDQLPKELLNESNEIMSKLKQGNKVENMSKELEGIFRPSVQPFMISWMEYAPTEEIEKLDMPILVINGERDLQVPKHEVELLNETNDNTTLLLLGKMNHVLKEAPENREGNLDTYVDPDLPLAKGLMDGIIDFLHGTNFLADE